MKKRLFTILLLFVAITAVAGKQPKYVFYFIGDGMGPSHVLGTELYLGEKNGVIGRPQKLCFTQFPITAFVTTFSASNGVTDSAASGTALATGNKTNNGHLGVTPESISAPLPDVPRRFSCIQCCARCTKSRIRSRSIYNSLYKPRNTRRIPCPPTQS